MLKTLFSILEIPIFIRQFDLFCGIHNALSCITAYCVQVMLTYCVHKLIFACNLAYYILFRVFGSRNLKLDHKNIFSVFSNSLFPFLTGETGFGFLLKIILYQVASNKMFKAPVNSNSNDVTLINQYPLVSHILYNCQRNRYLGSVFKA